MQGKFTNVSIKGIMSVVPKHIEDNLMYVNKLGNRRIEKQVKLTGINERRACINGQNATDLVTTAADKLLDKLNWERDSIDILVYVTQSPELMRPSTAFIIQKRLNIGNNCIVFDVNLGCSGYVAGLQIVAGLLQASKGRALLLTGESHAFETNDISTSSLLVGDAGCATALEYEENNIMYFKQQSNGKEYKKIFRPYNENAYMDGNGVLLFTLNDVANSITDMMNSLELKDEDIEFYVFHQAQKMIIDGLAYGCKLDANKVLYSCNKYGNTSSASIPLTLCVNKDSLYRDRKNKIYMCGFGIGLSWGSVVLDIDSKVVYEVIESDYIYEED